MGQGTGVLAHNAFTVGFSGIEGERMHRPHIRKERESRKCDLF